MNPIEFLRDLPQIMESGIATYGIWIYGILFLIVFCETGLVFMPFLPGDSLLFTAGVLAHQDSGLNVWILFGVFITAALCGDNVNYFVGRFFGERLFNKPNSKLFNKKNLDKTHEFMEKHGPKAIIIARFVPFIRTFLPFVAGMGKMDYKRFLGWSVLGAFIWVTVCVFAGYFFGKLPFVKENFETVIFLLIGFTLIPVVIEVYRHKMKAKKAAQFDPES